MERNTLTGRQSYYLLCLFLLGNFVTAGGLKGIYSGWLLYLLLIPLVLAMLWLFSNLPKGPGLVLQIVFCPLAILIAGDSIRLFADFIVINDLNDAGAWGNAGLMTVIVLFLLYCDLPGLGKAAWGLFPFCMILLAASVVLTADKMDLRRLLPLLDTDGQTVFRGVIGTLTGTAAPALFPVQSICRGSTRSGRRPVLLAGLTICVIMSVMCLRDSAVLGYPAAAMFRFPGYEAAGTTRHSEVLVSAVFVLTQPFRTALCLRYVQTCLTNWNPRYKALYPILLLSLSVMTSILTWSSERARWRTGGELAVLCLAILGPLATYLLHKLKKVS